MISKREMLNSSSSIKSTFSRLTEWKIRRGYTAHTHIHTRTVQQSTRRVNTDKNPLAS